MSAISLKSITGITSITTPAGVDNQLTLHNNNTTEAVKLDVAGNLHFHNHLNITGVSTASNFKTGTSNLHNTGLNVQDLDVDGHANLDNVSIAGVTTFSGNLDANGVVYIRQYTSPTIYLTSTSTTGDCRLFFGDPDSNLVGRLSYVHNGDYFNFYAAYGERFRIAGNGDITITSIDANATGPTLKLFHNSGSPAANDVVSRISMFGDDSAGNETEYGRIETKVDNVTDGQETAHINFATRGLGSYANVFRIKRRSTASAPSYTTDDADGMILDVYNTGNPYPRYMNFIAKSAGNTDSNITFWTEAVGGSPAEKLRITSDGKLLVGNTSATNGSIAEFSKSVAGGGAGCHITVENTSNNSVNNTAGIHLKTATGTAKFFKYQAAQTFIQSAAGGASELILQASGAHPMRLYAGDAERVRIEDTGEVYFYGNQTSAPEGDFGFRWDRNNAVDFTIKNTNNTSVNAGARIRLIANIGNIAMHYVNNGGFYLNNSASGYLHYYTGGTSRLYIDPSGNVTLNNAGTIGTSNGGIGKRIGVKSDLNNIIIGETTNSGNFGLILESRVTGRSGNARSSQIGLGNQVIDFYTASAGSDVTKKMEIKDSGQVVFTNGSFSNNVDCIMGNGGTLTIGGQSSIIMRTQTNNVFSLDYKGSINQNSIGGSISYFKGSSEYIFGSNASAPNQGGHEALFQIHHGKSRATASVNAFYNNSGGPILQFISSRSNTIGTLGTKCQSNDYLAELRFWGDNGTVNGTLAQGASIWVRAKSTPADGDTVIASEINFDTGSASGGSLSNVLKLRQDQQIEMTGAQKVKINGVIEYYAAATMRNDTAYNFDFTVRNEGGYGNSYYIVVGYNHFHTSAYGAQRVAIVCTRGTSLTINADITNQSHSQAGGWSFSKPNSTTLRITKSAGTYGGTGYGFIRMTGNGNTMGT